MWLRSAGFLPLMCGPLKKNPTADSKHSPTPRLGEKFNKSITWWASLLVEWKISGSLVKDCGICPLGWKRLHLGKNKEPNVSCGREKPVISTQEDLLTWRETGGDVEDSRAAMEASCADGKPICRLVDIHNTLQRIILNKSGRSILLWMCKYIWHLQGTVTV